MALDEFMGWFQQAPRPGFRKATVSAWRVSLEDRRLVEVEFLSIVSERIPIFLRVFFKIFKRGAPCDEQAVGDAPAIGSKGGPLIDSLQGLPQGLSFNRVAFPG